MNSSALPKPYDEFVPYAVLRPAQAKAVQAGLLLGRSVLVATPTASGKTLIAALACLRARINGSVAVYLAPLKALAAEKQRELASYGLKAVLSVGDYDDDDAELGESEVIVTTPEKLDSLLRHSVPWLGRAQVIIVDEIHLLGDSSRGPTLEVLLTVLRTVLPDAQIVALSATVKNSAELAHWLKAELVLDNWRPVELREAVQVNGELVYKKK